MTAINALRYLFAFLICSWSGTSDDDDFDDDDEEEKCLDVVVVVVFIAEAVSRGIECPRHFLPPSPTPLPLLDDEKKEAINRKEVEEEEETTR